MTACRIKSSFETSDAFARPQASLTRHRRPRVSVTQDPPSPPVSGVSPSPSSPANPQQFYYHPSHLRIQSPSSVLSKFVVIICRLPRCCSFVGQCACGEGPGMLHCGGRSCRHVLRSRWPVVEEAQRVGQSLFQSSSCAVLRRGTTVMEACVL